VAAVAPLPAPGPDALTGDLTVVLVDVADPGNTGTLMRTAEAAGAVAVACCGSTADPFGPKAVRASAGSVLRLAVLADRDVAEILGALGAAGATRLGLATDGPEPYDTVDLTGPVAIVLGSEAHGLPTGLAPGAGLVDRLVSIPMAGRTESLNVATAGAIVCFEAARQRRAGA
jgi:TrmH family RNA methyltransferase